MTANDDAQKQLEKIRYNLSDQIHRQAQQMETFMAKYLNNAPYLFIYTAKPIHGAPMFRAQVNQDMKHSIMDRWMDMIHECRCIRDLLRQKSCRAILAERQKSILHLRNRALELIPLNQKLHRETRVTPDTPEFAAMAIAGQVAQCGGPNILNETRPKSSLARRVADWPLRFQVAYSAKRLAEAFEGKDPTALADWLEAGRQAREPLIQLIDQYGELRTQVLEQIAAACDRLLEKLQQITAME